MNTAARIEHLVERIGDYANPILVKETRQALKSRFFVVSFMLLLLAAWVITVFGVMLSGQRIQYGAPASGFFFMYYMILVVATHLLVPFAAYRSLLTEREQYTFDLLSITNLTPGQIVMGKLQSAMVQTLIFYSAIAPFVAFTALLGGFDFVVVSMVMVATLCISMANSTLGLMLSTLGRQRQMQTLNSLGFLGLMVWQMGAYLTLVGSAMSDVLPLSDPDFWWTVGIVVVVGLSYVILAFQVATAQLTFETDNRSTAIRVTCSAQFFLLVAGFMGYYIFSGAGGSLVDILTTLLLFSSIHWTIVGQVMATEPNHLSYRIRRNLPNNRLLRLGMVPFLPGGSRGLIYFLLHMAVLLGLFAAVMFFPSAVSPRDWERLMSMAVAACGYMTIYTGLGAWLARVGGALTPEFKAMHARVCVMVFFALGLIVPYIPMMTGITPWNDFTVLHVMNPFEIINRIERDSMDMLWAISFIAVFAFLVIFLNLRAMLRSVSEVMKSAARPRRDESPSTETAAPPEVAATTAASMQ